MIGWSFSWQISWELQVWKPESTFVVTGLFCSLTLSHYLATTTALFVWLLCLFVWIRELQVFKDLLWAELKWFWETVVFWDECKSEWAEWKFKKWREHPEIKMSPERRAWMSIVIFVVKNLMYENMPQMFVCSKLSECWHKLSLSVPAHGTKFGLNSWSITAVPHYIPLCEEFCVLLFMHQL